MIKAEQYKQWLWFKKIRRIDLKGKERILKLPVSPITFKSSDWNNKENWADFETAVNNIEGSGSDGLSFVLSIDDPFLCIDLDNVSCDMREKFFRDFHDTYIETSQSGKGLHIFAKGEIADNFNNQIEKVEMYQNNRCIAMTGNSVVGTSNNIVDEWKLEASVKSKKVRIDGVVRVSKKFYKRNINIDFVEVNAEDIPF